MNTLIPTPVGPIFYLRLKRNLYSENSVIGWLFLSRIDKTGGKEDGKVFASLERAWKKNKRGESCIPPGIYPLEYKEYGRFYDIYSDRWQHKFVVKICKVKNRSEILLHTGNKPEHSRGCVLVGTEEYPKTNDAIPKSWKAYQEFYRQMAKHRPQYIIVEQPDGHGVTNWKPKK